MRTKLQSQYGTRISLVVIKEQKESVTYLINMLHALHVYARESWHVHTSALTLHLHVQLIVRLCAEQVVYELIVDLEHAHVNAEVADVSTLRGLTEELREGTLVDTRVV